MKFIIIQLNERQTEKLFALEEAIGIILTTKALRAQRITKSLTNTEH